MYCLNSEYVLGFDASGVLSVLKVIWEDNAIIGNTVIMREMAPIGEMAPGCAKKCQERTIKKPVRTRCHLTHDYGVLPYGQ